MGRLKKHHSDEERKEAQKQAAKRYYWKNKDKIDSAMKLRYHRKKNEL